MDETIITGDLPHMKVQISHRADADNGAEVMTIHLVATPDFQSALPLLANLTQMSPLMAPMTLWTQALEAWMTPWRSLSHFNPFLRALGGDDDRK